MKAKLLLKSISYYVTEVLILGVEFCKKKVLLKFVLQIDFISNKQFWTSIMKFQGGGIFRPLESRLSGGQYARRASYMKKINF